MMTVTTEASGQPPKKLGMGVFGLALLNTAVINSFPFLAGALSDQWHLDSMRVGLLITIELLVYAAAAILLSAPSLRINARAVGLAGCAVFAIGNLLASTVSTYLGLAITGSIAGLGGGLAVAAAGRAIALTDVPARLLSYIGIPLSIAGTILALGSGAIVSAHGYGGGCIYLAVIAVVGAAFAAFLPNASRVTADSQERGARSYQWSAACLALGASGCIFLGSGSVWSFSERIGLSTGLSAAEVTSALGLTSLAGIVGALAAVGAAKMRRDFLWAAMASILFGGSVCTLALASSPISYVIALSVLSFAFIFTTPFLTAIAIRVDHSGGLAGAVQGVQMLTGAIAPFLGGALLMTGSFRVLAILAAITTALAVLCVIGTQRLVQPLPTGT